MRCIRARIALVLIAFWVVAAAGEARAAVVQFGWSGTVASVTPAFAAGLPAGSSIAVGAPAFVRFDFESATADQDPATSTGNYAGALRSYTLQIGTFAFTQKAGGPVNTINVFTDPLFGFYEPVTSVDPSSPIAGFTVLKGDVLFIPMSPPQIPTDALILAIPDPPLWSTASAAVLDPFGNVLLEVDLGAICTGSCQPRWPPPGVPTIARSARFILVWLMLLLGSVVGMRRLVPR